MKLLLKKATRINHEAGEIVEVSPAQAAFLLSVGVAEIVKPRKKETTVKTVETREKKK